MSDEGFLKRWSRRKRAEAPPPAADADGTDAPPSELPLRAEEGFRDSPSPAVRAKAGMGDSRPDDPLPDAQDGDAIDPATLPPIDSLGPDSDYTLFLRKGVPEAIRIAALRKAWMSDPFIRDFRGPAEYALDYTTSEFDLRPTDDVAKMLDRIFPPQPAASEAPAAAPQAAPRAPSLPEPAGRDAASARALNSPQKPADLPAPDAPRQRMAQEPPAPRRKHGGALPGEGE